MSEMISKLIVLQVVVFTPDDLHLPIGTPKLCLRFYFNIPLALAAVTRKLHVLVAKPAVKTLGHHQQLVHAAQEHGQCIF